MRLATCPNSWGVWYADDPGNLPWDAFLDGVAAIGFEHIEAGPYGYLPTDPTQLKEQLNNRNISLVTGQVHGNLHEAGDWPTLEKQTREVGALVAAMGGENLLLIGGSSVNHVTFKRIAPAQLTEKQWRIMVDAIERIGRISLDDYGLRTVFHPTIHGFCDPRADQTERMLAETNPNYVWLCLDTGQFFYRNGDPLPWLRAHANRIHHIHCKDIVPDIHAKLAKQHIPFSQWFCPLGEGQVDFQTLLNALNELNYEGFLVIDEDQYGAPPERLRQVSRSSFERLSGMSRAGVHDDR